MTTKTTPKSVLCYCDAYNFPHRKGSGKCQELLYCHHGKRLREHDDYDPEYDYCHDCEWEEYADIQHDTRFER